MSGVEEKKDGGGKRLGQGGRADGDGIYVYVCGRGLVGGCQCCKS